MKKDIIYIIIKSFAMLLILIAMILGIMVMRGNKSKDNLLNLEYDLLTGQKKSLTIDKKDIKQLKELEDKIIIEF